MTTGDSAYLLWGVGALVLAISALAAHRPTGSTVLRSLLAWAIIGGLIFAIVAYREELGRIASGIKRDLGLQAQSVEGGAVRIRQAADGHFWADVRINGVERRMLVDSGATTTALSQQTATEAGVEAGGLPVVLTTANGAVSAARGQIDKLSIGSLDAYDLPVVVSATFGSVDVLGMNFLSQLGSWRVGDRTLILQPASATN